MANGGSDMDDKTKDGGGARGLKLRLKLSLEGEGGRVFFGPGVMELLKDVRETGSIQGAARKMGLSYVKALKILRQSEEGIGRAFLIRRKGGNERGKSELTAFGERFLERYEAFRGEAERELGRRFEAVAAEVFAGEEKP